jgi:hypothetical protein
MKPKFLSKIAFSGILICNTFSVVPYIGNVKVKSAFPLRNGPDTIFLKKADPTLRNGKAEPPLIKGESRYKLLGKSKSTIEKWLILESTSSWKVHSILINAGSGFEKSGSTIKMGDPYPTCLRKADPPLRNDDLDLTLLENSDPPFINGGSGWDSLVKRNS